MTSVTTPTSIDVCENRRRGIFMRFVKINVRLFSRDVAIDKAHVY